MSIVIAADTLLKVSDPCPVGFADSFQLEPKLATREDGDGRLPIHWAASSNSLEIVLLLAQQHAFDPDVQV